MNRQNGWKRFAERKTTFIAAFSLAAILLYFWLRFGLNLSAEQARWPLFATYIFGGIPLVYDLVCKMFRREFGSDLLAGISITTAIFLGEYLAGAIVVLMLSGGDALETYAMRNASSVLHALARRMPSIAHRKSDDRIDDVSINDIAIGDVIVVFPHEICPVDGEVLEGHGVMDESFLTGEPFEIEKAPGSEVISGAVNGHAALIIRATKRPVDSRYAKIMEVMRASEQNRPRMRRLGDQLGAFYTPLALAIALAAWLASGDAIRFLAVLVIATPCPLLIAIPVSIIGSISLSARRGIIVKNPVALEQIDKCRVAIFDKTGTLTYGEPHLTEQIVAPGFSSAEILRLAASIERYSRHPLAKAILTAAHEAGIAPGEAMQVSEPPGRGLRGTVDGRTVEITNRRKLRMDSVTGTEHLPPTTTGLECLIVVDGRYAATYRFRDTPRKEGRSFIMHLAPKHHFKKLMIVSGDREPEVRYLADQVGIQEIHSQKSPEEKFEIVRKETDQEKTVYVGDGINDAPAMMSATVGIAIGQNSDVTAEAADVVIMEGELKKLDEFMHISRRMRSIALQSAVGGMALSVAGMIIAAFGFLPPVAGAVTQEVIDVLAVVNAIRAAWPPRAITDFDD